MKSVTLPAQKIPVLAGDKIYREAQKNKIVPGQQSRHWRNEKGNWTNLRSVLLHN